MVRQFVTGSCSVSIRSTRGPKRLAGCQIEAHRDEFVAAGGTNDLCQIPIPEGEVVAPCAWCASSNGLIQSFIWRGEE